MKSYLEKLKDPRWQKKRLEIMQRDEFTCQFCLENEQTLHVHHRLYVFGNDPWDYPDDTLVTVCKTCHDWETEGLKHAILDLSNLLRVQFGVSNLRRIGKAFSLLPSMHFFDRMNFVDSLNNCLHPDNYQKFLSFAQSLNYVKTEINGDHPTD